jgi:GNAT superfamily N-acetyltransferase
MMGISEMSLFSPTIGTFWLTPFLDGEVISRDGDLTVVANANLDSDKRVMVLRTVDRKVYAVLTPAMANKLGLYRHKALTEPLLRQKMHEGNVELHGADYVFHFTEAKKHALLQEQLHVGVRQLNLADEAVFASFQSSASEQDLDDAYVALDHWAVFGAFEQEHLVCAASMYSWSGQKVADVGVLTLPPHRGMGHASRVVRAISRYAYEQGYEPQYRCQIDNVASVSLARSAGLGLFGTWEVVSPDCVE